MRKRAIAMVRWVLVALLTLFVVVCATFGNYLLNQIPGLDKVPAIAQWLASRSDIEKIWLLGGAVIAIALLVLPITGIMERLRQGSGVDERRSFGAWQSQLPLESGARQNLLRKQLGIVEARLEQMRSVAIALPHKDAPEQVDGQSLDWEEAPAKPANLLEQMKRLIPFRRGAADEDLPQGKPMLEVFRHPQVHGRLLILGSPGAGKTTTLLELGQALLKEARLDGTKPLPHLFELARWEPGMPLAEWLVAELKREDNLDPSVGRGLVARGELLPLLDGLDELRLLDRIEAAMGAINDYLLRDETGHRDVVVCCRREDYGAARSKLTALNGAVELQPLSDGAIRHYLEAQNQGHLWPMIEANPALLADDLLRTPLFLSVFAEVNPSRTVAGVDELWDLYIQQRLAIPLDQLSGKNYRPYTPQNAPSPEQTRHHLAFLAQQLKRTKPEFLIEEMQPIWLSLLPQPWRFTVISGLILGLIMGPILGPILSLTSDPIINSILTSTPILIIGLVMGPLIGLVLGLILRPISALILGKPFIILPMEEIQFYRLIKQDKKALKRLRFGLVLGLAWGLNLGLCLGVFASLSLSSVSGFIWGLTIGLSSGPILGLILGLMSKLKVRSLPNQGIRASVRNMAILLTVFLIFATSLNFVLPSHVKQFLSTTRSHSLPNSIFAAIVLTTFMFGGGLAAIQHFSLRLVLYTTHLRPRNPNSRAIPWNYARFLSYASDRKLLHQTGGSFRFIHRSLLEHFANMP